MAQMPKRWWKLAADLLELAGDKFSSHGCNDMEVPAGWTHEDMVEFGRAYEDWNSEGKDFDPENVWPLDYAAMWFLADKLRSMADEETPGEGEP